MIVVSGVNKASLTVFPLGKMIGEVVEWIARIPGRDATLPSKTTFKMVRSEVSLTYLRIDM